VSNFKLLEIRDRGTCFAVAAFDTTPNNLAQDQLFRAAGFASEPREIVLVEIMAGGGKATCDPYDWTGSRTMHNAHKFIREHWDKLIDGSVVCVEFALGEREEPKRAELT